MSAASRKREPKHGTRSWYTNHGCRCQPCVEANRRYKREYLRARVADGLCDGHGHPLKVEGASR